MATRTRSRKPAKPAINVYEDVTNNVLEAMDQGTLIWQQPWATATSQQLPTNMASGKPYSGINVFLLAFEALNKYGSPFWGTFKQIKDRGGYVRKGEHHTDIVFWKIYTKEDEEGNEKSLRVLRYFQVFNADQCEWPEGSKPPVVPERTQIDPIQAAEDLVASYLARGPEVRHGGNRAFYRTGDDHIQMPKLEDFISAEHYYSTLFHEITHSTGHQGRLDRTSIAEGTFGAFGDPCYSFEELIAEMGAAMLCAVAGIDQAAVIPATAAYLRHWRDQLERDNKLILQAASAAQKAVDYVLGVKRGEEG